MFDFNFLANKIHPYGVCCTLGIIVAAVVACVLARKKGFEFFDFALVIIITLVGALVGAKLLFLIVSWKSICDLFETYPTWQAILSIVQGGYVFYGGLIGGVLGLVITLKVKKAKFLDYANIFALVLPLGHAFGRVGCFFAGCCYGVEYEGFLSYTYSSALDISTPIGVPLLPIQLIEAVALLVLFAVMLWVYLSPKHQNKICYIYILGYSILRFVLEFFRGDVERGLLLRLSTSQWVSVCIVLATGIYMVVDRVRKNKAQTTN